MALSKIALEDARDRMVAAGGSCVYGFTLTTDDGLNETAERIVEGMPEWTAVVDDDFNQYEWLTSGRTPSQQPVSVYSEGA